MSREVLSEDQFPRRGWINEPSVSARVHEYKPGHFYLHNLAVTPSRRGQGIGSRFMADILKEHDAAGTTLSLHTARPELERWYGSMGFENEGEDILGTRMTRKPRERG